MNEKHPKITCVACGKKRPSIGASQPVCNKCWKKWYYRCEKDCKHHSTAHAGDGEYYDFCSVLGPMYNTGSSGIMKRKNCGSFKRMSLKERWYWFVFAFKERFGIP